MNTNAPSAKVSAGAIAGAVVAAIVFALNYWLLIDKPIPGELAALVTFVVTSLVAYLTPPSARDVAAIKP